MSDFTCKGTFSCHRRPPGSGPDRSPFVSSFLEAGSAPPAAVPAGCTSECSRSHVSTGAGGSFVATAVGKERVSGTPREWESSLTSARSKGFMPTKHSEAMEQRKCHSSSRVVESSTCLPGFVAWRLCPVWERERERPVCAASRAWSEFSYSRSRVISFSKHRLVF